MTQECVKYTMKVLTSHLGEKKKRIEAAEGLLSLCEAIVISNSEEMDAELHQDQLPVPNENKEEANEGHLDSTREHGKAQAQSEPHLTSTQETYRDRVVDHRRQRIMNDYFHSSHTDVVSV